MAKPNYAFAKHQRDVAKKKEKRGKAETERRSKTANRC